MQLSYGVAAGALKPLEDMLTAAMAYRAADTMSDALLSEALEQRRKGSILTLAVAVATVLLTVDKACRRAARFEQGWTAARVQMPVEEVSFKANVLLPKWKQPLATWQLWHTCRHT